MKRFEYNTCLVEAPAPCLFGSDVRRDKHIAAIEATLNRLGGEGWELIAVYPFTDGSPLGPQIRHAIHYFKREIAG